MKLESSFQADLIKAIRARLPGSRVLKNDAGYIQGFPDLTVLHNGRYALLESKRMVKSKKQPNQDFYINEANQTGAYGAFVQPENCEAVLQELERRLKK